MCVEIASICSSFFLMLICGSQASYINLYKIVHNLNTPSWCYVSGFLVLEKRHTQNCLPIASVFNHAIFLVHIFAPKAWAFIANTIWVLSRLLIFVKWEMPHARKVQHCCGWSVVEFDIKSKQLICCEMDKLRDKFSSLDFVHCFFCLRSIVQRSNECLIYRVMSYVILCWSSPWQEHKKTMMAVQTILPNWTTSLAEHASIVAERNLSPFFLEEASADSMCAFS